MKQSWITGLDKEQVKDVKVNYLEALVMRRRLIKMLEAKVGSSHKAGRSKEAYSSPNWALEQADARGYERAMADVIDLINDDPEK